MSAPVRRPVVPAEATQELQAADVLEVLGTGQVGPSRPVGRAPTHSQSSIAPVGLDLAAGADNGEEEDDGEEARPALDSRLPVRRRRLGVIVVGAVTTCALILVAAGIARVGHASDQTSALPQPQKPATAAVAAAVATSTATPTGLAVTPPPAQAPVSVGARPADSSSTGTVRLDRPATTARVWLDGKRLSSSSLLVSCGTHQIKVGRSRKHSIDVPCGGEIVVSR
jgi:hypothetical protein